MERWDKYWIGILVGLILPAAFGWIYIEHYHLWNTFFSLGWRMSPVMSKLLFVSIFPNMAFLFVFYTMDAWKFSKGLLIGAFPYLLAAIACTL